MEQTEIVEFALRTAELATENGDSGIACEMLLLAASLLRPYATPCTVTRTGPAVMVTTDYKQAPCS